MKYVSEESIAKARILEASLVNLPKAIGVLFASAVPQPVEGGSSTWVELTVGISRDAPLEVVDSSVSKCIEAVSSKGVTHHYVRVVGISSFDLTQ